MKDKLPIDKIKNWSLTIIVFAYFIIDVFPSVHLRNNVIYIVISSLVITLLACAFAYLAKNSFCTVSSILLTICVWSRIIPNARNIYIILLLTFSIFTIFAFIKITRSPHSSVPTNLEASLPIASLFSFLLFLFECIKITLFQTEWLHWGFIIAASTLSLIATIIMATIIIKKDSEKEFGWKLIPLLLFGALILTFILYLFLVNINYAFDFQKPKTVSANIIEIEHIQGGAKSIPFERMTVDVDGKEYELSINVYDAEEFSAGDQVNIEISKGLFGVEYYHCDKDVQPAN